MSKKKSKVDANVALAEEAVRLLQEVMSRTTGGEAEALATFIDIVGSQVDGWQMRLDELNMDYSTDE